MASAAATPTCAMPATMDKLAAQLRSPASTSFCICPTKRFQRLHMACRASLAAAPEKINSELVELEATTVEEPDSPLVPSPAEIRTLITEVCESDVAELGMKIGSQFKLHLKRSTPKPAPVAFAPPPAAAAAAPAAKPAAAAASTAAPAAAKPKASPVKVSPLMSKALVYEELQSAAAENGFVIINSPKVGVFRTSRFVKGKRGRPLCVEGKTVEIGQDVCMLEQLGTEHPVQADVSGEVVKVLFEDGVPVGFGDPLIMIKPGKAN